ncbi:unnamed protein product [Adineta steineri]|uniref:RanBD1 domain-containing protein n=1 Tax=Adineta steineri TaxID=433720 RepID=A0A814F8Q4_9BILA|nr:unnamed protein product [Adineta steineri]CAF0976598.1 unnamed protein product [Adineta steineri]
MSNNTETVSTNDDKTENEPNNINTSTPIRLFGQFKQNGSSFSNFRQLSSNGDNSPSPSTTTTTSYFANTVSKISSANNGGFGSSSTSLAASLAPLSSNKQLFGATNDAKSTLLAEKEEKEEDDNDDDKEDDDNDEDENNKTTPSLFETAAEYEAKRASTHPAANIQGDTSTGEEHEVTKFQMAGKLYMYSPEQQQFVERGYGILKINECHDPSDWNKLQARLIMRLDKSFRVILNSPIFPKMTIERATDRSVRFGAQDESQLRVFIIKSSTNECTNLCKELESRIQIIERQQTTPSSSSASSSNVTSPIKTNLNTSDTSPTDNLSTRIRKRSHSRSDSDTSDNTNDVSKKSKIIEQYQDDHKNTSDEDSIESTKAGEQETAI